MKERKESLPNRPVGINKVEPSKESKFAVGASIEREISSSSKSFKFTKGSETAAVKYGEGLQSTTHREQKVLIAIYPASASVDNISFQARERALTQHM